MMTIQTKLLHVHQCIPWRTKIWPMGQIQVTKSCHPACGEPYGSKILPVWQVVEALNVTVLGSLAINVASSPLATKFPDPGGSPTGQIQSMEPYHLACKAICGRKNLVSGRVAAARASGNTAMNAATTKFQAHRPDDTTLHSRSGLPLIQSAGLHELGTIDLYACVFSFSIIYFFMICD